LFHGDGFIVNKIMKYDPNEGSEWFQIIKKTEGWIKPNPLLMVLLTDCCLFLVWTYLKKLSNLQIEKRPTIS
jgi:hypothetical protein